MKTESTLEKLLKSVDVRDATSSIYYAVRVLARNREYDPKKNDLFVRGLLGEPNAKQKALSKSILKAIEASAGRRIPELLAKDSAKYIRLLSSSLKGMQKTSVDSQKAKALLTDIRKAYPEGLSSATPKVGASAKRKMSTAV